MDLENLAKLIVDLWQGLGIKYILIIAGVLWATFKIGYLFGMAMAIC